MSHTTDVQLHDRFIFQGLTGTTPLQEVLLEVTGIQIDGKLIVRASYALGREPSYAGEGEYIHHVPLVDAMHMVEQDIWKLVKP